MQDVNDVHHIIPFSAKKIVVVEDLPNQRRRLDPHEYNKLLRVANFARFQLS